MPLAKLKEFLDSHQIKYVVISHSRTITAQEVAASAHISGKLIAKTVMVNTDGVMAMAVLPASCRVDFVRLRDCAGAKVVTMAAENEFLEKFPNCECGAMPPFGNLYGMDVFVDKRLAEDKQIAFNAGSHSELVQLDYADYERLVKPKVCAFAAKL